MSIGASPPARARARTVALAIAVLLAATLAIGCSTASPAAISSGELAEAQTFPFFRLYWTGEHFLGYPLAAADGLRNYISSIGDGLYYGDCVQSGGIFGGGGSCRLPLQVTTVIYQQHSNQPLGPQSNLVVRGVPATMYDNGTSLEIYSGQVAIDVFSDTTAHLLAAADVLRPVNAPGSASAPLPLPVYCPGLYGPEPPALVHVMENLPHHICQSDAAHLAFAKSLKG